MGCTNNGEAPAAGRLRLVFGDVTLGVHGNGFDYIFSYACGGPESLVIEGREWLYRAPKPTFWRATTDNDRGSKFSFRSAAWLGADMFLPCIEVKVTVDGTAVETLRAPGNNRFTGDETARQVVVAFTYETVTVPAARIEAAYSVDADGGMLVEVHYHGTEGLPQLPVFGMRFVMPTRAEGYWYEGLSGETYPDRMAGGIPGIYEVKGLPVTPYLVPQDCGVHMNTQWLEVCRSSTLDNSCQDGERFSLRFEAAEKPFAFACLPYTAEELENATHQEELPPVRRTVVTVLGAVRGVGGIDSWGTDVEEAYHIDAARDIRYAFRIRPAASDISQEL